MYVGNVVLLIMNLPLVGVFAQILRVPLYILHPAILGVAIAGAYGVSGNMFERRPARRLRPARLRHAQAGFPTAPLILGFVLGDAMERAVRQSLTMSQGDLTILVQRPISAVMLAAAVLILLLPLLGTLQSRRACRRSPKADDRWFGW